jgi:hypothetical protein
MARKLNTYETSLGFFDLAIAAPSMKAALEAWGADSNLFHQGAAKKSEDPDVVAATMAKPGVVLKRPVGSNGPFKEQAELPTNLADATARLSKAARKPTGRKPGKTSSRPADKAAERKAAVAHEREQKRHDRARAREEAARQKEHEHRQEAVAKAKSALDKGERDHAERAGAIRAEADAIEKRAQAENVRWKKEKERLDAALQRARG